MGVKELGLMRDFLFFLSFFLEKASWVVVVVIVFVVSLASIRPVLSGSS